MTNEEAHEKAKAFGEAMRAACPLCKEGLPVVTMLAFGGADAGEWTMHTNAAGTYEPCAASNLHAEFDSFVQEAVSA